LLEDAEAQNNDEEKKARDLKEAVEQQLQVKIREIKGNFDKQLDDREKIIKQLEIDFEAEKKKCEDLVR
jgi:phage-related minor tail protein